jgi:hypothetical protein
MVKTYQIHLRQIAKNDFYVFFAFDEEQEKSFEAPTSEKYEHKSSIWQSDNGRKKNFQEFFLIFFTADSLLCSIHEDPVFNRHVSSLKVNKFLGTT